MLKVRTAIYAVWHILFKNTFSIRGGYLYVSSRSVRNASQQNGVTKIPLQRITNS